MKLGDFIDRVCNEYGGKVSEGRGSILSRRGSVVPRFLTRIDKNGEPRALLISPRMNADTEMTDSVVRSSCVQLGIDASDFDVEKE